MQPKVRTTKFHFHPSTTATGAKALKTSDRSGNVFALVKKDDQGQWQPVDSVASTVSPEETAANYALWCDQEMPVGLPLPGCELKTMGTFPFGMMVWTRPENGKVEPDEIKSLKPDRLPTGGFTSQRFQTVGHQLVVDDEGLALKEVRVEGDWTSTGEMARMAEQARQDPNTWNLAG